MNLFQIKEHLEESDPKTALSGPAPYVAVVSRTEWAIQQDMFDMGIDLELDLDAPHITKAEVNYDSLTGAFSLPDRHSPQTRDFNFTFALDEKGVVFIDDSDTALSYILAIGQCKKWRMPGLERFLYDFLEYILRDDLPLLEHYEERLNRLEQQILTNHTEGILSAVADIRGDLLALRTHYEQLLDLGQELGENENGFFHADALRYFDMFCARIMRLQDYVTTLRELTVQVRDLYQSQLSVRQNSIMTILTTVTVIFTPLTVIVGWYGMNFRYMPELQWRYSYPALIVICLLLTIGILYYFKKKKWL